MILDWGVPLSAAIVGAAGCFIAARVALRSPRDEDMRTNVDGKRVPVVLGWAVVIGGVAGLAFVIMWSSVTHAYSSVTSGYHSMPRIHTGLEWIDPTVTSAIALLLGGLFLAGRWDDLKGDERPRGFAGHLRALRGGAVTGGLVKLVVGAAVSLGVAAMTLGGIDRVTTLTLLALATALGANLINLLDRAPGRAGKAALLIAIPLALVGDPLWRTVAAGTIGATLAALPLDLKAQGMLGDAGANPLGGLVGFGLAVNLAGSTLALVALISILLALNLASERWSFSDVIARNRWLARLDHLGRK